MKVNVYLTYDGNCEGAFNFYKSVLGGEFQHLSRFGEMPPQEGMPPMPEEMKNKLMHVSLLFGEGNVLMGSDSGGGFGPDLQVGNNFSISINTVDLEETKRLFTGLSEGGTVTMPLDKTFWGAYFGMFTDQFGINWMVNCEIQE